MACDTTNCKDFLMQNRLKFGITENTLRTECLDICTQNVRCIASRQIRETIPLPSISGFLNSCTGMVDTANGIDTRFASLRVTCAREELVGCGTDNPGVRMVIKGQVIVRTMPCDRRCPPSYMAIPMELVNEVIRDFYSTKDGSRVENLKNELPYIDGSCMVINLCCRITRETTQTGSRYVATIGGSVVDKLWKNENIWVEGIRPYPAPSLTVCERFDRDVCQASEETQQQDDNARCYRSLEEEERQRCRRSLEEEERQRCRCNQEEEDRQGCRRLEEEERQRCRCNQEEEDRQGCRCNQDEDRSRCRRIMEDQCED